MGNFNTKDVNSFEPVTMNRIRDVCQRNTNMNKELVDFRIELLANDMNKLGFVIPIRDGSGKRVSNDAICQNINSAVPPRVEDVCMIGSKVSTNDIKKLVHHFNKYYGANIFLKRNPLDPNSPDRPVKNVCDDLYMVTDKVRRQLSDDADFVKGTLSKNIEKLKVQKAVLEGLFAKHIGMLHQGSNYDKMMADVNSAKALQQTMVNELDAQLKQLNTSYETVSNEVETKLQPNLDKLTEVLKGYAKTGLLSASDESNLKRASQLLDMTKYLAVSTGTCDSCIKKFFNDTTEYYNKSPNLPELLSTLNARYLMLRESNVDPKELAVIEKCYQTLSSDAQTCSRVQKTDKELSGIIKNAGDEYKDYVSKLPANRSETVITFGSDPDEKVISNAISSILSLEGGEMVGGGAEEFDEDALLRALSSI